MNSEYSNVSLGGGACSYANLSNYNMTNPNMTNGMMNPVPANPSALQTAGLYLVPNYGAPSYDTFGSKGSCSGFLNITDAYGKGANNCSTQYLKKICN